MLAQEDRVVVDNAAGTTVDPVDELITLGDRTWRFIDTAGIRKRVNQASGHEYYASLRTSTAIDRAEVAVLVLDASETVSEQDMRIIQTIRDAGRAMVIAFNKWDLVDEERRYYLEREIERDLVQLKWAPRINFTARTGWHVDRLVPAIDKALEGWETRIGTGALNTFLGRLVAEHPHPVRSGKQAKILFATQPSVGAADVRAVHERQARRVLRALHRAPAARGVRLRRHADRDHPEAAREAQALTGVSGGEPGGAQPVHRVDGAAACRGAPRGAGAGRWSCRSSRRSRSGRPRRRPGRCRPTTSVWWQYQTSVPSASVMIVRRP